MTVDVGYAPDLNNDLPAWPIFASAAVAVVLYKFARWVDKQPSEGL